MRAVFCYVALYNLVGIDEEDGCGGSKSSEMPFIMYHTTWCNMLEDSQLDTTVCNFDSSFRLLYKWHWY